MKRLSYILFVVVTLTSCTETIELDLRQTPSKIVIEGLVTDQPGYQSVKVSRSVDFYDKGVTPRVTDAVVRVTDDLGQTFQFVHNPNNHPDSAGIYIAKSFVGQVGRKYSLRVEAGGESFEAADQLLSVLTTDSVTYRVNPEEAEDPKDFQKIYELLLYAKEPAEETNFYLFKFFRNDSLTYYNDTDIYFADDEFLAENIDGIPSPIFYAVHDEARIEIYSLSRQGYIYYNDLAILLTGDAGGMFGPIPGSPRTNLSNGALGFFQVSAVTRNELKIE
jgi:hypothetical protein